MYRRLVEFNRRAISDRTSRRIFQERVKYFFRIPNKIGRGLGLRYVQFVHAHVHCISMYNMLCVYIVHIICPFMHTCACMHTCTYIYLHTQLPHTHIHVQTCVHGTNAKACTHMCNCLISIPIQGTTWNRVFHSSQIALLDNITMTTTCTTETISS